ncbi:MAG TPA: UDP-N-acetylmuramoyl-tripeptide--D-alanyl-D-alanine ligase [Candidatus Limnocylindria bacterium]|nr:UDP-N-acetylmuramoyl-tripeptide--D-alanyl-D-alanine ligase [Candidatus Limnocylindria bacterium]
MTGVEIDSRRIGRGDLFVAAGGGAAYLDDARARGAAATLVPGDEHAALAALARAVRERSTARVVAITGSVGKTSTKDILAALLRGRVSLVAARDGYNNEIGVPLTLCEIEPDTEVVVTELAMRGLGQIRELAEITRPHVGVITSIGPVHLGLLGSMENIARAKAELLDFVEIAILPEHAPELEPFVPSGIDVRRFGMPDVEIRSGHAVVNGVEFSFSARHQATNALAALTALDALGIDPPDDVVEVEFSRWRSQESELRGGGLLINDAWNANPVAMRAALDNLRERANGRRTVAILGDMAELGPDAPRFHEEIGQARNGLDVVIGVGELARGYAPDVWAANAAEAIELARAHVRPGDAVLVKGSRSVGLEVVAEALS